MLLLWYNYKSQLLMGENNERNTNLDYFVFASFYNPVEDVYRTHTNTL